MTPVCRECHQDGVHKLSCSHVRYDGELLVQPADLVSLSQEPAQPYCPGPDVACHYDDYRQADGLCARTGSTCYYHHED